MLPGTVMLGAAHRGRLAGVQQGAQSASNAARATNLRGGAAGPVGAGPVHEGAWMAGQHCRTSFNRTSSPARSGRRGCRTGPQTCCRGGVAGARWRPDEPGARLVRPSAARTWCSRPFRELGAVVDLSAQPGAEDDGSTLFRHLVKQGLPQHVPGPCRDSQVFWYENCRLL